MDNQCSQLILHVRHTDHANTQTTIEMFRLKSGISALMCYTTT